MKILSLVSATIAPGRRVDVDEPYREALAAGLPPGIERTYLLVADDGTVAIATVWTSAEALAEMRSSGEEPLARRLLREAGGDPRASFFEIAVEAAKEPA